MSDFHILAVAKVLNTTKTSIYTRFRLGLTETPKNKTQ